MIEYHSEAKFSEECIFQTFKTQKSSSKNDELLLVFIAFFHIEAAAEGINLLNEVPKVSSRYARREAEQSAKTQNSFDKSWLTKHQIVIVITNK